MSGFVLDFVWILFGFLFVFFCFFLIVFWIFLIFFWFFSLSMGFQLFFFEICFFFVFLIFFDDFGFQLFFWFQLDFSWIFFSVGEPTSLKKKSKKKTKQNPFFYFLILIGSIPKSNRIEIKKNQNKIGKNRGKYFYCLLPNSQIGRIVKPTQGGQGAKGWEASHLTKLTRSASQPHRI